MAWYRNFYRCSECGSAWEDEWSCMCDDDCPNCGSRHWTPYESQDLTFLVERENDEYLIYESPLAAGHYPNYRLVSVALSQGGADAYLRMKASRYWSANSA